MYSIYIFKQFALIDFTGKKFKNCIKIYDIPERAIKDIKFISKVVSVNAYFSWEVLDTLGIVA